MSFKKKILALEDPTNVDCWRGFCNEIEALITDKKSRKKQISNPGSNSEFPTEGVANEDVEIRLELDELVVLQGYVTAKAN